MPNALILIDSSFLIALFDRRAPRHDEVVIAFDLYGGDFLLPQIVLTEAVYYMKKKYGVPGAVRFMDAIEAVQMPLQDVTYADLANAKLIMAEYADNEFDFVDCCLMALAQRLALTQIGTLDQRDFTVYRPPHALHFDLLP